MFSAFKNCSGNDNDPVIVYVSKMFSVLPGSISANKHRYMRVQTDGRNVPTEWGVPVTSQLITFAVPIQQYGAVPIPCHTSCIKYHQKYQIESPFTAAPSTPAPPRPLTDDEIERRRDAARLRNQQKLTVNFNPETIGTATVAES